jgi:D-sedoheptulose 7-phosphate isomerase
MTALAEDFTRYTKALSASLNEINLGMLSKLGESLLNCWKNKKCLYICGNGGSAANAIHLANDFIYGIAKVHAGGMRVISLSSNPAVITCLANDIGYDFIYSEQLAVQAQKGDILLCLSGSGNSPNIVNVLSQAKSMAIQSFAILGFDGGKSKSLADVAIHLPVKDMQIAEDSQLIIGHIIMQWLYSKRLEVV